MCAYIKVLLACKAYFAGHEGMTNQPSVKRHPSRKHRNPKLQLGPGSDAALHLSVCSTSLCMHVQARTRKLEAESKLAGLQKDLAELGTVSGDQAGQEEAQTMQLHQVWPFSHLAKRSVRSRNLIDQQQLSCKNAVHDHNVHAAVEATCLCSRMYIRLCRLWPTAVIPVFAHVSDHRYQVVCACQSSSNKIIFPLRMRNVALLQHEQESVCWSLIEP